jgi:hypothetical protein
MFLVKSNTNQGVTNMNKTHLTLIALTIAGIIYLVITGYSPDSMTTGTVNETATIELEAIIAFFLTVPVFVIALYKNTGKGSW